MRTITEFDGITEVAPTTAEPDPDFLLGDGRNETPTTLSRVKFVNDAAGVQMLSSTARQAVNRSGIRFHTSDVTSAASAVLRLVSIRSRPKE